MPEHTGTWPPVHTGSAHLATVATQHTTPLSLQSRLPSSLDRIYPQISTWSKKEKRTYSCAINGLRRCLFKKIPVFFLTLTSAPHQGSNLALNWELLVKRIRRTLKMAFHYMKVETSEGNGVLHVLFHGAFQGWEYRNVHAWFSKTWGELHKSPVVWCTNVRYDNTKRIAGYMVQYVSSQKGFLRKSQSRDWIFAGWRSKFLGLISTYGFSKGLSLWSPYLLHYTPSQSNTFNLPICI